MRLASNFINKSIANMHSSVVFFGIAIAICSARSEPVEGWRHRRELADECRPPFPRHHQSSRNSEEPEKMPPICCDLPDIAPFTPEAFVKCQEIMHGGPPRPGSRSLQRSGLRQMSAKVIKKADENHNEAPPPPPPPPPFFQERKECMAHCLFNVSGYLNSDEMLNEETLNQKLLEEVANNSQWTSTIDPVFKKCIAAAKEANSQSQKSCRPAAAEYVKCMSRELFFNCPNEVWVNSPECNDFKNKLEKCPNLHPPPHRPLRPRKAVQTQQF